jgi:hypothetical protein
MPTPRGLFQNLVVAAPVFFDEPFEAHKTPDNEALLLKNVVRKDVAARAIRALSRILSSSDPGSAGSQNETLDFSGWLCYGITVQVMHTHLECVVYRQRFVPDPALQAQHERAICSGLVSGRC